LPLLKLSPQQDDVAMSRNAGSAWTPVRGLVRATVAALLTGVALAIPLGFLAIRTPQVVLNFWLLSIALTGVPTGLGLVISTFLCHDGG